MDSSTTAAFVPTATGVYRLEAPLTFASVPSLRDEGVAMIHAAAGSGSALTLELHAVPSVDSAGLALLIDWLAEAKSIACHLKYLQPSDALVALARLSDVARLLAA